MLNAGFIRRVGVVQIHPVFVELLHAFDTRPPIKSEVDLE